MLLTSAHPHSALVDVLPDEPLRTHPRPAAPLLPVAIGLISGIVIDNAISASLETILAQMAVSIFLFHRSKKSLLVKTIAVLLSAAAAGMLRHAICDRFVAPNAIGLFAEDNPALIQISGQVVDEPKIKAPLEHSASSGSKPRTRFLLDARELRGKAGPINVQGLVSIAVKASVPSLHEDDHVTMTGWLYRPLPPRNPGEYDWRLHYHRAGIDAAFSCEHAESVRIVGNRKSELRSSDFQLPTFHFETLRNHLRSYLIDPAFDADDEAAGILSAMVLGRRTEVSKTINEAFVRTGNSHFLAASGTNVGWLAMFGWWVLMRLGGLHYRKVVIIIAVMIGLFLVVAEPQPSILRAAIIGLLGCWALFVGGRRYLDNALACSAIIILMINPNDLFRPAFQLSYLAVIAITRLEPKFADAVARFCEKRNWFRLAALFNPDLYAPSLFDPHAHAHSSTGLLAKIFSPRLITMSFSAWLITVPLTCYHFNQFTPWGWFGTLALWFLIVPLTFLGFVTVLCGLIVPASGALLGPILGYGTHATLWLVEELASVPFTLLPGRNPSISWVLGCYAIFAWLMFRRIGNAGPEQLPAARSKMQKLRSKISIIATFLIVAWWLIPPRWVNGSAGALNVWMLSVGGGTGTVIELPDGNAIMYDLGTRSDFDVGQTALAFLSHRGITAIEAVYVSHTDSDHLNGIATLAKTMPVGRIVLNDHFESFIHRNESAAGFLKTMHELGIPIETTHGDVGREIAPGVQLTSFWPPPRNQIRFVEANATSTVLRLEYQGKSILLPGDIESEAEALLLKNSADKLRADVLALPHHGSTTPLTGGFIKAVNPAFTVRSTGQSRLMTTNGIDKLVGTSRYYSTADDGCVHIEIREQELTVRSFIKEK